MVIVYLRMWRAAKRFQKRDKMAMKWSLTLDPIPSTVTTPATTKKSTERLSNASTVTIGQSSQWKHSSSGNPLRKFQHKFSSPLLNTSQTSSTGSSILTTNTLKRFQRPSAILNAVRVPLVTFL